MKRINSYLLLIFVIWVCLPNGFLYAGPSNKNTLPRFASLKFNNVNVRAGPAFDCPIDWVYKRKMLPVKVVAVFDTWRKIIDLRGEGGWVHSSALSIKQGVIIDSKHQVMLYKKPDNKKIIAIIEPNAIGALLKEEGLWCQVQFVSSEQKKITGWLPKKEVWGV